MRKLAVGVVAVCGAFLALNAPVVGAAVPSCTADVEWQAESTTGWPPWYIGVTYTNVVCSSGATFSTPQDRIALGSIVWTGLAADVMGGSTMDATSAEGSGRTGVLTASPEALKARLLRAGPGILATEEHQPAGRCGTDCWKTEMVQLGSS